MKERRNENEVRRKWVNELQASEGTSLFSWVELSLILCVSLLA